VKLIVAGVVLLLTFVTSALADLTNPSTLKLKEISPSQFTVELTLPIIQGRVLKARPILPDVCAVDKDVEVQGDAWKVVRTWTMTCDPDKLVGTAIGVQGLLGTTLDVQLTLETLDGRKYIGQLRPTQAYYLVPPAPTLRSMAVDIGGMALRQVLRHLELVILFLLFVIFGVRLSTSARAMAEVGELDWRLSVFACNADRLNGACDRIEHHSKKGLITACRVADLCLFHGAHGSALWRQRVTR
jgi:hypothetical protein